MQLQYIIGTFDLLIRKIHLITIQTSFCLRFKILKFEYRESWNGDRYRRCSNCELLSGKTFTWTHRYKRRCYYDSSRAAIGRALRLAVAFFLFFFFWQYEERRVEIGSARKKEKDRRVGRRRERESRGDGPENASRGPIDSLLFLLKSTRWPPRWWARCRI